MPQIVCVFRILRRAASNAPRFPAVRSDLIGVSNKGGPVLEPAVLWYLKSYRHGLKRRRPDGESDTLYKRKYNEEAFLFAVLAPYSL